MKSYAEELEFYLAHEEETKIQRENFLRNEPVDSAIIPPHILRSWQRCADMSLNPYALNYATTNKEYVIRSSEQFSKVSLNVNHEVSLSNQGESFLISIADKHGRLLLDYKPLKDYWCSERVIGTTSAGIALREKRTATCFGYQNYKAPFIERFGVSSPVISKYQDLIGVVTITIPRSRLTPDSFQEALKILELIRLVVRLGNIPFDESPEAMDLISQIVPSLTDGFIYVNAHGEIQKSNKCALQILDASHNDSAESIIRKIKKITTTASERHNHKGLQIIEKSNQAGTLYLLKEHSTKTAVIPTSVAKYRFKNLLGNSKKFLDAKRDATIVASSDVPVLIYGETGAGKELFAQAIHNESLRQSKPFISINCGAVPESLIESALFGYEPGAFTGALAKGKIGLLEAASGGTLFLDEIESMPMYVQVELLRALSYGYINRVGGVELIPINIRVISAAKTDLLVASKEDKFRADLYFRISTCCIRIPPLRERKDDIVLLAKHFVEINCKQFGVQSVDITDDFLECLYYYPWQGNVRELENVIQRAMVFMDPKLKVLSRNLLPRDFLEISDSNRATAQIDKPKRTSGALMEEEEQVLHRFLVQNNYNVREAAKELGISHQTLYRKIRSRPLLYSAFKNAKQKNTAK